MRSSAPVVLAAALLIGLPSPAGALLLELDLFSPGDRLVTRDTASGLDWLDIAATGTFQPQPGFVLFPSYDDIAAGFGGWTTSGWRYATDAEVCGLFALQGAAPDPCPGGPTTLAGDAFAPLRVLMGLSASFIGVQVQLAIIAGLYGLPDADSGLVGHANLGLTTTFIGSDSTLFVLPNQKDPTLEMAAIGHFLVREVPAPGGAGLLAIGFGALTLVRTRRARGGR